MALNDIKVPKENAQGTFDEIALAASDLKLGTTANLPLKTGTNGVVEAGAFGTAAGSFCEGNDARLSDARTPSSTLAHKASHATGGTDALAPSDIGAQSIFLTEDLGTITANVQLTAARAKIYTVTVNTFDTPTPSVRLPQTGVQAGDVVQIRFTTFTGREMPVRNGNNSFLGNSLTNGQRATYIAASTSNDSWAEDGTNRHTHVVADVTGAAASGSITASGLTQATARILGRTTASTGAVEELAASDVRTFLNTDELSATRTPTSHVHGNLTNDGKVGSDSGRVLVTTTAGAVTTLALGTAGQVLTVNSGASGVEFAAASGGGVTGAASSASDVLGVSGANITGVDATADRIVFWDDSASALKYLEAGSGLSLSGTTLTATASGGSKTYAVFTATDNQPPATAFATLDTRNSIAVLDFDDTTDESAVFVGIIPEGASLGSGLKIRLHWMSTNQTSNNVVWDVSLERMTTDLDADSFDTIASGTAAANTTQSGILTVTEITLTTIDSVTAGDGYRLKVTRDANNGSDNMSDDAELVAVEVRSAA
jgi:hypothetical protein